MKIRAVLFLLVFLAGAVLGYYAGQEPTRRAAKRTFNDLSLRVEEWVEASLGKLTPVAAKARKKQGSTETQAASRATPNLQDQGEYIRQFVEIVGLEAKRDNASTTACTISGAIHNKGTRPVKRLEITAYFIGKEGIVSETGCAVVDKTVLAANGSAEFRFRVESVPGDWLVGKVRASVTEIEFAE